ncbi:single-stranded DNA-binding protein [Staphylococcus epidermidis]|uniref:single-stranded DNA-binding protein n=1 Tax=Staphylococcus epidermidis TaxID=1282 RepID=UPI0020B33085|nr:single-stranded DNA-binding protein [Staphylococcus epidermidis]UTF67252.1 single-stranded DNA-binding protein [Staphylococcus epidermidis]
MINRAVLVGRLTKDPEFRQTASGVSVTTFTLAVNRTFKNKNGEREADFINIVVFRQQAENVNNYLSKGSLAGVDGRIQSRSYDNNEGQRVFVTEVVADNVQFLDSGNKNNNNQNGGYQQNNNYQQNNGYQPNNNYQPTQQNNSYQPPQQNQNNYQPPQQQNTSYQPPQQNQQQNPFANANGPIDIQDEDLPF